MLKKMNLLAVTALVLFAAITSCKKSNDLQSNVTTAPATSGITVLPSGLGDTVPFEDIETKGYLVWVAANTYGARNFHQGTVADLTDSTKWATKAGTYYYSFADNDGLSGTGVSSYDFKFTGSATADLVVDTSRNTLSYINTDFNSVTSTTGATAIPGGVSSYNSLTGVGNSGSAGWYVYSLATHVVVPFAPRTYFVTSKSTGVVHKIRINSIYWNATPVGTPPTNYPYYSFDYKQL